jgi:hypothetical protein
MAQSCESLNFTKTLKYISYKTKNDPAMLLHTLQYRSEAVPGQKNRGYIAKTQKTEQLKHRISRDGATELW